jgi:hypothetical protein
VSVRVEVKAKDHDGFLFEMVGVGPIPRVGDHVEFADGLGVVERVIWKADSAKRKDTDLTVLCECVAATPSSGTGGPDA